MLALLNNNSTDIISAFQNFINDQAFPCVGAKSALAHQQIEFCVVQNFTSSENDAYVTQRLQEYASRCSASSLFVSFVVIYENDSALDEVGFEHYLWERLQAFHTIDAENYSWDEDVSSDPESPHFSMSIGGKGFYVIGLHPYASRQARRFQRPALVFNLHSQFELLRDQGSYKRIRDTILARDFKVNGTYNPMLAQHGQASEARQYSGREIGEEWKCPFHAKQKANANDP